MVNSWETPECGEIHFEGGKAIFNREICLHEINEYVDKSLTFHKLQNGSYKLNNFNFSQIFRNNFPRQKVFPRKARKGLLSNPGKVA